MIVIGGLEGLFITMMPLTFLDGATVKGWSRLGWALDVRRRHLPVVAAPAQPGHRLRRRLPADERPASCCIVLGVFMLTTGGLWLYFRFRQAAEGPA